MRQGILPFCVLVLPFLGILSCRSPARAEQSGNDLPTTPGTGTGSDTIQLTTQIGFSGATLKAGNQIMVLSVGQPLTFSFDDGENFDLTNGLDIDPLFDQ